MFALDISVGLASLGPGLICGWRDALGWIDWVVVGGWELVGGVVGEKKPGKKKQGKWQKTQEKLAISDPKKQEK